MRGDPPSLLGGFQDKTADFSVTSVTSNGPSGADGLSAKEYVYRVTAVNKVGQSKALESDTAYKAKSPYGELFLYLIFSPIKM
jgi:hypothetical protein